MADAREEAALRAEVARLEAENARFRAVVSFSVEMGHHIDCDFLRKPAGLCNCGWDELAAALAPPPAPADEVSG
jgi:hypothetical protein